jgi:pimeloyl-ACP methyl ester carboxylesterase
MSTTVMFVHGMFLNPQSWELWQQYFERKGYETVAPAWPLHKGDPRTLRANIPPGLGELSLDEVIDAMRQAAVRYDDLVLVGHSVGGLIVQKLIAEGIGRLGVTICSVAPNRMLSVDWGFLRNSASITNPLKGNEPYPMDADGFHKNFGNTMDRGASDAAYEKYAMHESRNVLRDCLGHTGQIDLAPARAPLLFLSADKDEIIPTELCEKNAKAYSQPPNYVDYFEFKNRGHFICGQPDWQEVAGYIANWIVDVSDARAHSPQHITGSVGVMLPSSE